MTAQEYIEITKKKIWIADGEEDSKETWQKIATCIADDIILLKGRFDSAAALLDRAEADRLARSRFV